MTLEADGRALHKHRGFKQICLASSGRADGELSGMWRESGTGVLGEVAGLRTHSRGTMLAPAPLLCAVPDEKCPLFCSLSCVSTSSETVRGSSSHCRRRSLLCPRMEKQTQRAAAHWAGPESQKVVELGFEPTSRDSKLTCITTLHSPLRASEGSILRQ